MRYVVHPPVTSGTGLARNSTIPGIFVAGLVLLVTLVACTTTPRTDAVTDGATTTSTSAVSGSSILPSGVGLTIEVTRVSDGDSLRATSVEGELEIRLLGVNAPERDDCFGEEARTELERLLATGSVTLHPWPGETDQFGRQLGLLVASDVFVNLSLVESGHVIARAQSDHGFDDEFESAERVASEAERGLWAPDACGTPSDAELTIVEIEDDPPGDDRQNPNGEWVIIENGSTEVDLAGWVLRDESTRHRYTFPAVSVPPEGTVQVFVGCGEDELGGPDIVLYWCDPEPPVWNNGGDTAFLLDPNGAIADSKTTEG